MSVVTPAYRLVTSPRDVALTVGLILLGALWLTPLTAWARTSFSTHMLLHVGIVSVAAPLLGAGLATRIAPPAGFRSALSWCLLACVGEFVAVWIWHAPALHDLAMRNMTGFAFEQASYLLGSLGLWVTVIAAQRRKGALAGAAALFLTFSHMSLFGILLALAPRLLYDASICNGLFGFDRIDDQHLGGVVMVGGGLAPLIGSIALAGRALRRP